jgi:hypothetical protein
MEVLRVGTVLKVLGTLQFFRTAFKGVVFAQLQLVDARWVDVKTDGDALFAEFDGQGETYIAEANDGDGFVLQVHGGFWEIFRAYKKFFEIEFLSCTVELISATLANANCPKRMHDAHQTTFFFSASA